MTQPDTAAAVLLNFRDRLDGNLTQPAFFKTIAAVYGIEPFTPEFTNVLTSLTSACAGIEVWLDSANVRPAAKEDYADVVATILSSLKPSQLLSSGASFISVYGDSVRSTLVSLDDRLHLDQRRYPEEIPPIDEVLEAIETLQDFVDGVEDPRNSTLLFQLLSCLEFAYRNYDSLGPQAVYDNATAILGAILPHLAANQPKKDRGKLLKAIAMIGAVQAAVVCANEAVDQGKQLFANLQEGAALASAAAEGGRKMITHAPEESKDQVVKER